MKAIVSTTASWGIGYKGKLLIHNPLDMKHFVSCTTGHTVIMGTTTFESFPKGPLKHRRNIVLAFDAHYERAGFPRVTCAADGTQQVNYEVFTSIPDALRAIDTTDTWVIGGATVYKQLLDACSEVIVTKHDVNCEADAYFPNLDDRSDWHITETSQTHYTQDGIAFRFVTYTHA